MKLEEQFWLGFDLVVPAAILAEGTVRNEWSWFTKTVKSILQDAQRLGKTGNPVGSLSYTQVEFSRRKGPHRQDQGESGRLKDPATGKPDTVWHAEYIATLFL